MVMELYVVVVETILKRFSPQHQLCLALVKVIRGLEGVMTAKTVLLATTHRMNGAGTASIILIEGWRRQRKD